MAKARQKIGDLRASGTRLSLEKHSRAASSSPDAMPLPPTTPRQRLYTPFCQHPACPIVPACNCSNRVQQASITSLAANGRLGLSCRSFPVFAAQQRQGHGLGHSGATVASFIDLTKTQVTGTFMRLARRLVAQTPHRTAGNLAFMAAAGARTDVVMEVGRRGFAAAKVTAPVVTPSEAALLFRRSDAVCFDVDSTVVNQEAIDAYADFMGVGAKVAELTKRSVTLLGDMPRCLLLTALEAQRDERDHALRGRLARPSRSHPTNPRKLGPISGRGSYRND